MQYLRRAETESNNCSDYNTLNLDINQGDQHITRELALNPDSIRRASLFCAALGRVNPHFAKMIHALGSHAVKRQLGRATTLSSRLRVNSGAIKC